MKKIKFDWGHLILIFVTFVIAFLIVKDFCVKRNIEKSNSFIIAKFESKIRFPKTTDFNFTYFINGKKYTTSNTGIKYSILNSSKEKKLIDSLKINCFYLAKLNKDYPNIIIVDPTKKITDISTITKAGFTKEEIKKE
jgi:hypothetical protein